MNDEFWAEVFQHGIKNQLMIVRKSAYRYYVVQISNNCGFARAFTLPGEQYISKLSGTIVFEGKYDACEAYIEKNVTPLDIAPPK